MRGVSGMGRKENADADWFCTGRRRTHGALGGMRIKTTMTAVGLSRPGARCWSLQVSRRDHSGIWSMLS